MPDKTKYTLKLASYPDGAWYASENGNVLIDSAPRPFLLASVNFPTGNAGAAAPTEEEARERATLADLIASVPDFLAANGEVGRLRDAIQFAIYWIPRNGTEAMHKLCDALGHRRQPGFSPTLLQVENGHLRARIAKLLDAAEVAASTIVGAIDGDWDGNREGWEACEERLRAAMRFDPALCPADDDQCETCGKDRSQHEHRSPDHPFRWDGEETAPAKPSQTVCGHKGCTHQPGHTPGHHD
jgi:hypothetical protein